MSEPITLYLVKTNEPFVTASPSFARQLVAGGEYGYEPGEKQKTLDKMEATQTSKQTAPPKQKTATKRGTKN